MGESNQQHRGCEIVRDVLLEVRHNTTDPAIKTESQSLAEEAGLYGLSICTVVCHDILAKIQHVNKLLQSEIKQIDVAVDLLKKTEASRQLQRHCFFFCPSI